MSVIIDDDKDTAELPKTTHAVDAQGRTVTKIVVAAGFAVIALLLFLLIISTPVEDPARIALGPVSLNNFFLWLGGLHPLAQIPAVLAVFALVVAVLLVLIE